MLITDLVQEVTIRGEHPYMTATLIGPRHVLTCDHERGWYMEGGRLRDFVDRDGSRVPWDLRRKIVGRDLMVYRLARPVVRDVYATLPCRSSMPDSRGLLTYADGSSSWADIYPGDPWLMHRGGKASVAGDSGSGTFVQCPLGVAIVGVRVTSSADAAVHPVADRIAELVERTGGRVIWSDAEQGPADLDGDGDSDINDVLLAARRIDAAIAAGRLTRERVESVLKSDGAGWAAVRRLLGLAEGEGGS